LAEPPAVRRRAPDRRLRGGRGSARPALIGPQPTENALAARRILRSDALPAIEQRLETRKSFIDQVAGVATEHALTALGPGETASGGWALLRAGIGIVSNVATIVPPASEGGPPQSFTSGVLLGAMVAAVAGDRLLATGAGTAPVPVPGVRVDEPPADSRAEAAALADELLDPIASPQSRATFAGDLIGQMDQDIPGIDHALAGATLRVLGVWLAQAAAEVAAPIANDGLLRRRQNAAPAGCGFAGALIAQIGLMLT
jgi:hypothetical protein